MGLAAALAAAWRGCQVGGERDLSEEHPGLREGASHPRRGATKEESWTWGSSEERCSQVKAVGQEKCAGSRVVWIHASGRSSHLMALTISRGLPQT